MLRFKIWCYGTSTNGALDSLDMDEFDSWVGPVPLF